MFTYEPSYYALLFVPVFFFFLLQYYFRQNSIRGYWLLPMLGLPLLLSFSIGVMGAILALLIGFGIFALFTRNPPDGFVCLRCGCEFQPAVDTRR